MILILLIFLFSFSFSKIIDHQVPSNIYYQSPANIKVYTDYNPNDIVQFNIYYRGGSSGPYMMGKLTSLSSDYYSYTISPHFLNSKYLEYYILLETSSGEYVSIPEIDPHDVPISLRVSESNSFDSIDFDETGLQSDVNIISPQPGQNVLEEDLFIALSYFRMPDIDEQLTQIFIDNINMSNRAEIRQSSLTLSPVSMKQGYHTIKVIILDQEGNQYDPVKWNFYIIGEKDKKISRSSFSGKVWNDFLDNKVDTVNAYTNNSNLNLNFESDWVNIKTKLKKSSLENKYSQARDRYSFAFDMNKLKIHYGDFYPNMNEFILRGNRVRGVGFKYDSRFFQVDLVTGELARAIQGNPYEDAIVISDYSSEYICTSFGDDPTTDEIEDAENCLEGYDNRSLDISRSNYTFKRDISALRLGVGNKDRLNFGFNILKVKDDVKSVDKNVTNAIIALPHDIEIFQNFNSDTFIDLGNTIGEYDDGEPIYEDGINTFQPDGSWEYDDLVDIQVALNDPAYSIEPRTIESSIYIEDCQDLITFYQANDIGNCENGTTYPLIQFVWDIKVANSTLENYLSTNYGDNLATPDVDESLYDEVNFLEDQWAGANPKDNITLASDFSFKSRNKNIKFRTSVAMSMLNENIWNPVKSVDEFDTYSDEYKDCEFGTTYSNIQFQFVDGLYTGTDCTDNFILGGCNPGDYYWVNCEAFIYEDGINDTKINLEILQSGVPLDAIPDPESFQDIFHYNFDAIPAIPFYSIIQNLEGTGTCDKGTCGDLINVSQSACSDPTAWVAIEDEDACEEALGNWTTEPYSFQLADLMNSPEIAYDMDFSLKVLNNQIKFGIKQVGQSFNTLGNPYLQKDMREKYISDKLRILENRMFLAFKYSIITNGISGVSGLDKSNKFDVNISYYPGIDLPSFNLSLANYTRSSGEFEDGYDNLSTYWGLNDDTDEHECLGTDEDLDILLCETDLTGSFDTRVNTETNNYNLSVNHTFDYIYKHNATFTYYYSSKKDLLLSERNVDDSYVSPRSRSRNLGINMKTVFTEKWEGNFNYSNSSFDYAQIESEYYNEQQINSLSGAFSYRMNDKIERIGGGLDYVNGSGSSSYNQFSIRMYSEFLLLQNLNLNIRYNYRIKKIKSSDDYYNSLFKVNLSYRF